MEMWSLFCTRVTLESHATEAEWVRGPARFLHFLQTMGTALYNPEHNIDLSTVKVSYYYAVNHNDHSDDLGKNDQDSLEGAHKRLETAVRVRTVP